MGKFKAFLVSLLEVVHAAITNYMQQRGLLLCAVSLPNGTIFSLSATFGASKVMSAISNATEAVATLEASHGIVVNDIMLLRSGWSKLDSRVARAKTVATNDVTLEKIDTSDTTKFGVGSGTGSIKEVLTWQEISQILETSTDGGELQYTTYKLMADDTEHRIPTRKSAKGMTLRIADDDTLPHFPLLLTTDGSRVLQVVRAALPTGSKIYFPVIVGFNPTPSMTIDEVMALTASFSYQADETRYAT
jgi:hypothetical protein